MNSHIIDRIKFREGMATISRLLGARLWRVDSREGRRDALLAYYNRKGKVVLKRMVYLSDTVKPGIVHHVIATVEEDGYLVSALKTPNQNKDSYVEVMVNEGHPLFDRIHNAVATLNIAGDLQEVPGVGEAYKTGVYHIFFTEEEHAAILKVS